MDASHWRAQLSDIYGGRDWILAMDVLAPMSRVVRTLKELGAGRLLCIAASRGAGEPPDPELAPNPIVLGITARDMMDGIRASLDALAGLPPEAVAQVEAFDPQRQLKVIGTIFDDGRPVAGREKFGARPQSWQDLEDKTVIDEIWDAVGVPRAPARVVPVSREALLAAHAGLDLGAGTVWAGDNSEGFHGGASGTRWVRTPEAAEAAVRWMTGRFAEARVMPFLDGLPCSIHGVVFSDYVAALRPCEMLVFRDPETAAFRYAGAATYWDPPEADRAQMRAMVKEVGAHLRARVGYRGAFTIDGVMTADGFLPTELNPRFGAALGTIASGAKELPLMLMNLAVVAVPDADWQPEAFEAALLESADARRDGGPGMVLTGARIEEGGRLKLTRGPEGWRVAEEGEPLHGTLFYGPSAAGTYAKVLLEEAYLERGASAAPVAIVVMGFVAAHLGLELGALSPAPELR